MSALADQLAQIRSAPRGPKIAAFFDYDGTLIEGFSASAIYRDRIRRLDVGLAEFAQTVLVALRGVENEQDYAAVLELSRPALAGKTYGELLATGERLFRNDTSALLRPQMWQIIRTHREMGHCIVIASSATRFQIEPIAREIEADHALCTEVEVVDGVLTGEILHRPLWGAGKAAAVRALAREHGLDLDASFAYSDGSEDVPYLESVGHPAAVSPRTGMRAVAESRGWPILELRNPSHHKGLMLARTAAFYSAFVASAAAGIVGGLTRRDPHLMMQTLPKGNDLGLALAGVRVDILDGEEHLFSARPCVFVFNHQSKLDLAVLIHLLKRDITGIAKKEVKTVPVIGHILDQAGVVFIDRADSAKAREQLEPAVQKLREEGLSLVIAPEGTRSSTPRLGPFKKGAFHIAMQAGVPIIPIVLRNTGELMWRGAQLLKPGTVEVTVLPPVATTRWKPGTVARHAEAVRQMFLTTLADWPVPEAEA